ncbi:MAG TPA: argininosuccinate lyase, partial [Candidatus Saccharimonadales bacterium]|nr:argininosuccinate lyase [Candidatus Saccharimonadales bacterium]
MKKLWHKNYTQNELAEMYAFGRSAVLDNRLTKVDALGSIAHAKMLSTIEVLSETEFVLLKNELLEVIKLYEDGKFVIDSHDEDVHTKIENFLTEKVGLPAKKIHTARSRNDQVVLDLRLFAKEELFEIFDSAADLVKAFQEMAVKYEFVPMPGYTHMQKAMPSSVGMWMGSFAESMIDDLLLLKSAFVITDQSPLGSGASYGVSLPINRTLVSELLGFEKLQNNSLYTMSGRVKFELAIMHALSQIMLTLSRFAQDLLLYTTSEYNFFKVDDSLMSGSSIMPQKKNLDIMEVLRSRSHLVVGHTQTAASIVAGLPSGYNVDFGETKELFIDTLDITSESMGIVKLVLKNLTPNEDVLLASCTPDLFATHAAYELVKKGMPFRDAYKEIGLNLDK